MADGVERSRPRPGGASVPNGDVAAAIARAYTEEWGRIVATLIRTTGDWSLAEDCAQDAFEKAALRWPGEGIPNNPGAWLTTVAKNRAIDRLRRAATEASKTEELAIMAELDELASAQERPDIEDDRLRLIFTCCHPALSMEARVALTLRTVAGLTTKEIASAFLVPEATMAQRLVRATRKVKNAGIPYRVPPGHLLGERLPGVLAVLYLLFNEGYSASAGEHLVRQSLAEEAIRIARLVVTLMRDEPEAAGLLSLMLLQHARRAARTDARGDLITLEEQDRALWDTAQIAEGEQVLRAALRLNRLGRYQLQAVIAATHAAAPSFEETDFGEILLAYDELARLDPSPLVAFNRAIARGMAEGPASGLDLLDLVAPQLGDYYLLPAARADFLRRLERWDEARQQYELAVAAAPTVPERRYLERRLRELAGGDRI